MPTKAKPRSRFWRKCRVYFRRFRLAIWLVTFTLLGALIYLNLVGLPDFLKRPLVNRLAERGLDVDFATLRWHWSRGFVAEQVRFGSSAGPNNPTLPRLTAGEVEFHLHLRALFQARVQVDSIALRNGKLVWTLTDANAPARVLTIANIESSLRLFPDDRWMLDDFRAQFGGAQFHLSGNLTNASAVRAWNLQSSSMAVWLARLRKLADVVDEITFTTPPELHLDLNGDARELGSFAALLTVRAAAVDTAWGRGQQGLLTTRLFPAGSNELSRAEINLQLQQAETRWANTTNLDLKLRLVAVAAHPELVDGAATLRVAGVESPWALVNGAQLKASWTQALTNPIPRSARAELHADRITTWLTRLADVDLSASLDCVTNPPAPEAALAFWNQLLPYQAQWAVRIGLLRSLAVQADQISAEGEWAAPRLSVTNLQAQLYQGSLAATAELDVNSRLVSGRARSDFELQRIVPLLSRSGQEWLRKFTWAQPPQLQCAAAGVLPPWTNPPPDFLRALRPTLQLAGEVALTNGTYQGIHADWATTHFYYTNLVWQLPDLTVGRPEGGLRLSHIANDATREYYFRLHSTIDPQAVLPLFTPEVRRGFDLCEFGAPPVVDGELWGQWYDHDRIGFRGRIALTNFSFRGETTDAIVSGLNYTNLVVTCLEPRIWRGTQALSAAGITADFVAKRTYFTNGYSTLDPTVIVHAIGPMVTRVMQPYHFGTPPRAYFNGYTSMGNPHDANIVFEGTGTEFESLNFRLQNYTARIHWYNNLLTVTNVTGDFYGGRGAGWAQFVFPDLDHAQYAFGVNITNAQLHQLVADVTRKDNKLEGALTGQLQITNAWTDSIHTWDGFGWAVLREGLLWEIPIFGVLSKPLDAILPGIANSRFSSASATFGLVNSVIRSDDLEMRSATMRLQYRGLVDFNGVIKARVTAEVLRDAPVVGSVISTLLWPVSKLFAYQISGTMKDPKSEPVYIPRLLMIPLNPLQTLNELLSPRPEKTNAPPPEPQTK